MCEKKSKKSYPIILCSLESKQDSEQSTTETHESSTEIYKLKNTFLIRKIGD